MEEIHNQPHIQMTNEAPWDPSSVGRRQLSWEEEERASLTSSVQINQHTISATRPEQPQLQMDESEYDILMASCSSVYRERLSFKDWCHQ
jgi:hypothetical protein